MGLLAGHAGAPGPSPDSGTKPRCRAKNRDRLKGVSQRYLPGTAECPLK